MALKVERSSVIALPAITFAKECISPGPLAIPDDGLEKGDRFGCRNSEVKVTPVVQEDVPLYTECIATLDGYVNAQIEPQVTGYLMKQNCREGTVVREGGVLRG